MCDLYPLSFIYMTSNISFLKLMKWPSSEPSDSMKSSISAKDVTTVNIHTEDRLRSNEKTPLISRKHVTIFILILFSFFLVIVLNLSLILSHSHSLSLSLILSFCLSSSPLSFSH
jgi:hypothetical protein